MPAILVILFIGLSTFFTQSKVYGQYDPVPTGGSPNRCTLDFQRPNIETSCVLCVMSFRSDLLPAYHSAKNLPCTEQQMVNHYCNGGLGLQAIDDCNALRYGICSQPPDYPCITPTRTVNQPTRTPTPPATVNTSLNPRGCGILYTAGVPSCWCNNGGGQGLCGSLPLDGPGGCRDLCERGEFVGPKGYTHCFMMSDGSECRSNDDGTYRFCTNRCLPGSPGLSQTVGCEFPNKTVFGKAQFATSCILDLGKSQNSAFFAIFESFLKGIAQIIDIKNYISNLIRVPGLQKAGCNPAKETCTFE